MSPQHPLEAGTIRVLSRRLLPFLMLLYLIAYIDRANISVAALQMNADLGLTARMYGWGAGLFYVTYILFEVPSNVILSRVGARRWIARIMVTWGLIACGMAFIQNATQLYMMRLLLGAAEAGFTPGIIYYLSRWFPQRHRARAMAFFYIAAALASVIGLPLSGALLKLDGLVGFAGWRWLYFVEGLPAVILGFVVLRLLPDEPHHARWLSPEQRDWLTSSIAGESANAPPHLAGGWRRAFSDGRVWLLSLFWLLQAFGTVGITLFLPQIIKTMSGTGDFVTSLLAALPFVVACAFMLLNSRHSDATRERRLHLALPMFAAGLLLAIAVGIEDTRVAYVLLVFTVALNWAATPVFWATTTEYLAGGAAAAAAIALINAIANLAGVGLPPFMGQLWDKSGTYSGGLLLISVALLLGGVIACLLKRHSPTAAVSAHESPV
jgi:ACS family tartrate transporter-like MFS transporter